MTTKPTYLDLLTKRAEANTRPIGRAPLCLDPQRMMVLSEAREALAEAEKMAKLNPRRKFADRDPIADARGAVEAASAAVKEASLRLVFEGRTTAEVAAVVNKAPEGTEADGLNQLLLLDAFLYAETLDGERLEEITGDKLAELLPTLTSGEVNILMHARNLASSGPDFPM